MKNLKNLGQAISKVEQKKITGGIRNPTRFCTNCGYTSPGTMTCFFAPNWSIPVEVYCR